MLCAYLTSVLLLLPLLNSSGLRMESLLLLRLGLGAILVEQLERLRGSVAVEGLLELRDRGWDFEAHVENLLLALEADVFGPSRKERLSDCGLCKMAQECESVRRAVV